VLDNLLKRLAADWNDFAATPKDYLIEGAKIVSFVRTPGLQTHRQIHARGLRSCMDGGERKITSF